MIRLESVSKRYGRFTAVHPLDLHVRPGELFGFLGPNGAGKTTTIRMLVGVLRPTAGRVVVTGHDMETDPIAAKSRIGYIPDRPFVYDKLTGAEFLRFTAALFGHDGRDAERRIDELLELFELTRWKDELTESYSHGMRQKLIISSAFVHRPDVIVVDEPTVGLDPKSARLLKTLFRAFVDKGGTILMSTHSLDIVDGFCDRIGIIARGEMAALGTLDDLRGQAASDGAELEDLFLRLTGAHVEPDLDAVLG